MTRINSPYPNCLSHVPLVVNIVPPYFETCACCFTALNLLICFVLLYCSTFSCVQFAFRLMFNCHAIHALLLPTLLFRLTFCRTTLLTSMMLLAIFLHGQEAVLGTLTCEFVAIM
eukprot:m.264583 g.264583  ORF g.264583 m.264583 type:complete len:115 (+) comp15618_c0_seq8:1847-2191(+)